MKKHLIAVAVASTLAAPVMAQNVTLSGRIDASVGRAVNSSDVTTTRVASGLLTTNQIVLQATEDLGGGLKANFISASSFASDDNATFDFGSRGTMVGLSGAFGSVAIGKSTGSMLNSTTTSGVTGNIGNLTLLSNTARPDNAVHYTTPNMSGVTLGLVYSAGASAQEANPKVEGFTEISGSFTAGALQIRAARAETKNVNQTYSASTSIFGTVSTAATVTDAKVTETGADVNYNMGFARLNARIVTRDLDNSGNANNEFTDTGVGVAFPLGNGLTAIADYRDFNSKTDTSDYNVISLGLVKDLSKRTNAYAVYVARDNDTAADKKQSLLAIGLRHNF